LALLVTWCATLRLGFAGPAVPSVSRLQPSAVQAPAAVWLCAGALKP
jgi:hypothetical protein